MFFSAITALFGVGSAAQAEDLCRAKVLRDVSPVSGGAYVVPKGGNLTAFNHYSFDEFGNGMFCTHGGGCYPEYVTVEGQGRVRALELTNCKIVRRNDGYYTEVDRSRNSAADLRFNDIEDQLIAIGMGLAPADNAARHYVQNPDGSCGRLVKRALEGNPDARRRLAAGPPQFCAYDYGARR